MLTLDSASSEFVEGLVAPVAPLKQNNIKSSFTLEITTTALCDLSCTYCFEGEKTDTTRLDKDKGLIITRIDSILADKAWFQENYEALSISFWGGEPTLNPQFIIDIMNVYRHDNRVDFHLYTNAFNLKNLNKIVDNVDISQLKIQVSYDGRLVNDKYRLTKNKKSTSNQVLKNMYALAEKGVNVTMKSTLPLGNMETMLDNWLEFKEIHEHLQSIDKKLSIFYAPTIDYVAKVDSKEKDRLVAIFRNQMLGIAKQEIEFFKKHGRHLCSWFGGSSQRKHCSAGLNMAAISQKGDLLACHGAIYADNKEDTSYSSIHDVQFLEKLKNFSNSLVESSKNIHPECVDCVATTCMICPIVSNDRSTKEKFEDRWVDNFSNNLCGFFKAFGEIDRAIQKILVNQKNR